MVKSKVEPMKEKKREVEAMTLEQRIVNIDKS